MISINGILNLDKPYGITSMEALRRLKRVSIQKKIGHTGTLDPIATGVIPVCFGKATRLVEDIMNNEKEYVATIRLGLATDTYDALGKTVKETSLSKISFERIQDALSNFQGEILQIPPMFSAIKINGNRLYNLARSGVEVPREPRKVNVYDIELLDYSCPIVKLRIKCGKGFYVRSLANDLGSILGCGAIIQALTRTKSGPFEIENAITLDEAEENFVNKEFNNMIIPLDVAVNHLPIVNVTHEEANDLSNGKKIFSTEDSSIFSDSNSFSRYRVYDPKGLFVGIVRDEKNSLTFKPEKIFNLNLSLN